MRTSLLIIESTVVISDGTRLGNLAVWCLPHIHTDTGLSLSLSYSIYVSLSIHSHFSPPACFPITTPIFLLCALFSPPSPCLISLPNQPPSTLKRPERLSTVYLANSAGPRAFKNKKAEIFG